MDSDDHSRDGADIRHRMTTLGVRPQSRPLSVGPPGRRRRRRRRRTFVRVSRVCLSWQRTGFRWRTC